MRLLPSGEILRSLQKIVSDSYATSDWVIRYSYSMHDFSPTTPKAMADYVVMPKTVEEVKEIILLANKEKIPVTPISGGLGLGLWIPKKGGILMDLRRMNKILEVNEDALYAVVEPGVSIGMISAELSKSYPDLRVCLPDAPASASLLANYIGMSGFVSGHSKYGLGPELVLGLECVLPTGEVIRTGSWAYPGVTPHDRHIIGGGDFTGLFLGACGTLGVVTKAVIKLFPKPETVEAKLIGYENIGSAIKDIQMLLRREIADRIFGHNWILSWKAREVMPEEIKKVIGEKPIPLEYLPKWKEKVGLPEVFFWVILEGDHRLVKLKEEMFNEVVRKEYQMDADKFKDTLPGEKEDIIGLSMGKPSTVLPQLYMGAKSSYGLVSCWHLLEKWQDIYNGWMKIGCNYGMPFQAGLKPYQHGRWNMTKFVISYFDAGNPEECEKVGSLMHSLREFTLNNIHQPEHVFHSPAFFKKCLHYEFYRKVKNMLDPNGIMVPTLGE